MSPRCVQIQEDAAGLASLRESDPERQAAEAHVATCRDGCAEAWRRGQALAALLENAGPLPAPGAADLARVAAAIKQELAAGQDAAPSSPASRRPTRWWSVPAAQIAASAVFVIDALRDSVRGTQLATAAAMTIIAALSTALAITAGGLAMAAIPAASLLASALGANGSGLGAGEGFHCTGLELGFAALPFALAFAMARRGAFDRPRAALTSAAAGGALAAQGVLAFGCHAIPSAAHLFVFHTGGVLLAGFFALILSRGFRPVRSPVH
jgi:hypothetical protein